MKKNSNKGFSLVELIIVIAIMAVLIGVLAPQFIKYVEKSKQSTDITNLDSCVEVVKMYYADKTSVPASITVTAGNKGSKFSAGAAQAALTDGGSENSLQKGDWTTAPSAKVDLTSGAVVYSGSSKYYTATADGFSAL